MVSKITGTAAAVALAASIAWSPANAYEYGFLGLQQPNGLTHGGAGEAATPPPGLYAFLEPFGYEGHLTGAGAPVVNGVNPSANVTGAAIGVLYVPGWQFLGATYSAALFQPFFTASLGNPINFTALGVHNTLLEPLVLTWNTANHKFFTKLELGAYVPDGSITGPAGLGNIGTPWVTFFPTVTFTYIDQGYHLTGRFFQEINTTNYKTGYQSGSVFHAELTATKAFGNFKLGPIANFAGQVTSDRSSAYYGNLIQNNRSQIFAAGVIGGYDFGPANLEVWAFHDVVSRSYGGTIAGGANAPTSPRLTSVVARLSFRLFGDNPPEQAPLKMRY